MEGGPYQEYFYIEIPIAVGTTSSEGGSGGDSTSSVVWVERPRYRRFVYVQEEGARRFPMQFGLEVLIYAYIYLDIYMLFIMIIDVLFRHTVYTSIHLLVLYNHYCIILL